MMSIYVVCYRAIYGVCCVAA